MKIIVRLLFTVSHKNKHIYRCKSQYSSIRHISTNVKHLVKSHNIQHTTPLQQYKTPNAKTSHNVPIT